MLSKQSPVLLTTGERVPAGTNGGVTLQGTAASVAGAALMGTVAAISNDVLCILSKSKTCSVQVALQSASLYIRQLLMQFAEVVLRSCVGHSFGLHSKPGISMDLQVWSRSEVGIALILLGICWGTLGCCLDSLLGATLQFSGWNEDKKCVVGKPGSGVKSISGCAMLNNNGVNLVASTAITLCGVCVHVLPTVL
jgi:uncharacterized membrane protein